MAQYKIKQCIKATWSTCDTANYSPWFARWRH